MRNLAKVEVASSSLVSRSKFIPGLCNGSTTDFDSVSLGSIPSVPANHTKEHIMVLLLLVIIFCALYFIMRKL